MKDLQNAIHLSDYQSILMLLEHGVDINGEDPITNYRPLHYAMSVNSLDMIRFLHRNGADLNFTDKDGHNLLFFAGMDKSGDIVKYLLENGFNPNLEDKSGFTPLTVLLNGSKFEHAQLLLQHKANPNVLVEGSSLLGVLAEVSGHELDIALCLAYGANPNLIDNEGKTPLEYAIQGRQTANAALLIVRGAQFEPLSDSKRLKLKEMLGSEDIIYGSIEYALPHIEVFNNKMLEILAECFEETTILLDWECQSKATNKPLFLTVFNNINDLIKDYSRNKWHNLHSNYYKNLFKTAVLNSDIETLQTLLPNAHEMFFEDNKSLLHVAAKSGNAHVVSLILEYDNNVNCKDIFERTPLFDAIESGNLDVVRVLVNIGRACVNEVDNLGLMPLHVASKTNNRKILEFLIESGAYIDISRNMLSPIAYAASIGNLANVEMLLERKAYIDTDSTLSPLYQAVLYNHNDIVKLLLKRKCSANITNEEGNTLLHIAVLNSNIDIVSELITSGAYLNTRNNLGQTPLHLACNQSQAPIILKLISNGADAVISDNFRRLPIHYACENGDISTVNILINSGSSFQILDIHNQSPLNIAIRANNLYLSSLLIAYGAYITSDLEELTDEYNIKKILKSDHPQHEAYLMIKYFIANYNADIIYYNYDRYFGYNKSYVNEKKQTISNDWRGTELRSSSFVNSVFYTDENLRKCFIIINKYSDEIMDNLEIAFSNICSSRRTLLEL